MFPPEQSAGTERYTQALARALMTRGHDCLVLAGSAERASEPGVLVRDQGGLTVARLVGLRCRPGFRIDGYYDAAADGLIRTWLDLWRPDLVHLQHWYRLTGNLVAICAQAGIPAVVTLHDQWLACPRFHRVRSDGTFCAEQVVPCDVCVDRDPWQTDQEIERERGVRRQLLAEEFHLAGCLLVPSEAQRRLLIRIADLPPDRLQVVPLGAPVEWPQGTQEERRPDRDGALRIGYWGYLAPLKGVHTLLEAARLLAGESEGRIEWHLLGTPADAAYYATLQTAAEGLPVTFHGPYTHSDVAALDLDVAVFPSLCYETYSFVLDEAFQLGLPVLVSDLGAPADRIGRRGMTFRTGDPRDLAQRLLLLLREPARLEGLRRGLPAGGVVTMDAHARELEKIYRDIAMVKPPATDETAAYRALIAQREQQLADREQRLTDQDAQARTLTAELAAARGDLHATQAGADELRAALDTRTQELAAQTRDADELRAALELSTQELATRTRDADELRAALDTRTQELATRTRDADELRREAAESQRLLLEARQSALGSLDAALKRVADRFRRKDQRQ